MMEELHPTEFTYPININDPSELMRLVQLDQVHTEASGGIFPEMQFKDGMCVLDAACGAGGWAVRLAEAWPTVKVVGIDIAPNMIDYAHAQVEAAHLENATFLLGNIKDRLPFDDATFDAVNGRFLVAIMRSNEWQAFLAECYRVLKPGGTIRLTEAEAVMSPGSPAFERFTYWAIQACHHVGTAASDHYFGITARVPDMLKDAGFCEIQHRTIGFQCSHGTPYHHGLLQNYVYGGRMVRDFLIAQGVIAPTDDFEGAYQAALAEMELPTFCGMAHVLVAWAKKPEYT